MASSGSTMSVPAPPPPPTPPAGAWLSPSWGPYPAGVPLIAAGADGAASPWTYSEDEIVSLWTQIYDLLGIIGYFNEGDIIYPPADTGRHVLDRARLQGHFNMSDRVVSLLERLPYPRPGGLPHGGEWEFFFECTPFDYLNMAVSPEDVRDPHPGHMYGRDDDGPLPDYLLPDDVALVAPIQTDGLTWILDTKTGGIRTISDIAEMPTRPEWFVPERPDQWEHYRNWPSFPAVFVFKHYLRDLYDLETVPMGHGFAIAPTKGDLEGLLMGHTMRTAYGWPGSFRRDDWLRDRERIWQAASDLKEDVLGRDGTAAGRRRETETISLWREDPTQIPPLGV